MSPADRVALETLREGLRDQINDSTRGDARSRTPAGIRDVGRAPDTAKVIALLYPNGLPE